MTILYRFHDHLTSISELIVESLSNIGERFILLEGQLTEGGEGFSRVYTAALRAAAPRFRLSPVLGVSAVVSCLCSGPDSCQATCGMAGRPLPRFLSLVAQSSSTICRFPGRFFQLAGVVVHFTCFANSSLNNSIRNGRHQHEENEYSFSTSLALPFKLKYLNHIQSISYTDWCIKAGTKGNSDGDLQICQCTT